MSLASLSRQRKENKKSLDAEMRALRIGDGVGVPQLAFQVNCRLTNAGWFDLQAHQV